MHAKEAKKMTEKYLNDGVELKRQIDKAINGIEHSAEKGFYKTTTITTLPFTKNVLKALRAKGYRVQRNFINWDWLEVSWKKPK